MSGMGASRQQTVQTPDTVADVGALAAVSMRNAPASAPSLVNGSRHTMQRGFLTEIFARQ
jgi:hypothetical protein